MISGIWQRSSISYKNVLDIDSVVSDDMRRANFLHFQTISYVQQISSLARISLFKVIFKRARLSTGHSPWEKLDLSSVSCLCRAPA